MERLMQLERVKANFPRGNDEKKKIRLEPEKPYFAKNKNRYVPEKRNDLA